MYLVRVENGKEVDWKDVFGACPRKSTPSVKTVGSKDKVISNSKSGTNVYRLYGKSGGGGGHKLYVRWAKVQVKGMKGAVVAPKKYSKNFKFGSKYIYKSTEHKYKVGEFEIDFKPKRA